MNQSIAACGQTVDIGAPVVPWHQPGGFACPHPRGRLACSQHSPDLNNAPTQPASAYTIQDLTAAYSELVQSVYQLILHYDVCYCSYHCHEILKDSTFKGSHFYLDLDGTLYQTCDLYWKTNTAPADDGMGNERAVHVEIANLSWQALKDESSLYHVPRNVYRQVR
ncbi:MAG: N-acetylmuramyl-L-alanine amidase, partial [Nitrospinaceae bacterium]|nr:N-acetylmuramyl-L-alanine amidase [Nitrospinaceae bacterium]NIR53453.1 N-acetylmuramyl-L-alanine amidase [Nitrospinaceae bacterium]NIS83856.1 N-acetylmuramyl-L-alanine amidase [Nitrospinaceae bacterium]NIT80647.1 N-acetylmuramyl-L-alanine amidase [Nitrospinaceae bacterium]NIU42975.1 N-acetylmuramyl-L-alanine amidase [Nitrospinaceae bacterium]